MPDEEIDKIVKDAANQHHPPYDDTAWGKMEVLLDKHLPQKKDKKRPFIFLLSFLLLGSALFFIIQSTQNNNSTNSAASADEKKPGNLNKPNSVLATDNKPNAPVVNNTSVNSATKQTTDLSVVTSGVINIKDASPKITAQAGNKNDNTLYAGNINKNYNQKGRLAVKVKRPTATMGEDEENAQLKNKENAKTADDNSDTALTENVKTAIVAPNAVTINTADQQPAATEKTDSINKSTTEAEKANEKNKTTAAKKKTKKGFADKFALTLSAGADVSFIQLKNTGKLKPVYGAGLSYTIGKHFMVSSGLYVSKKVYTAQPSQYKFPGGTSYPHLVKIDGDCNVYEIPVNVYYNFKQVKNHNWLAGIGLSSLLIKKESYDYYYKTPAGQSYNYVRSLNNENEHYFSVLTFSGGYQYKLNNRVSFITEPYLKLPLGGVGAGKIKLNSTGILFTGVIKPFAKGRK
ncbi:porin family protein [Ferruginibacter sp.]|nr:hypothetical protein [Ferruginibacter sp.]